MMHDPTPPFAPPEAEPAALDGAWERLRAQTLAAPPSRLQALREAATPVRAAVVGLASLLGALVLVAAAGARHDLHEAGDQLTAPLLVLSVLALGAVRTALRPQDEAPPWSVAVGLLLFLPFVPASLPGVWPGPTLATSAFGCAAFGLLAGALPVTLVALVDRGAQPPAWRLLAGAAAGGLLATVVLQLHCPNVARTHLLVGHATVGPVLALLATAGLRRLSATRPRPPAPA